MLVLAETWRQLLHEYAAREEYRYTVDGDSIIIRFKAAGERHIGLKLNATDSFLVVFMFDERFVEEDRRPLAVMACNRWNAEKLIPKLYLNEHEDGQCDIVGEWSVPSCLGADLSSFTQVMEWAIATLDSVYEWLGENYGL
ncbi:MAG: YbjN domain-containing protein [Actinomycetales bacterium]|nr:YbjN domain-containing protein [Actinomycetales bacterium]